MKRSKLSRETRLAMWRYNLPLIALALPAIVWLIIFHYLPIGGVVVAFKDYSFAKGIFGSNWAGFKYFEYFFASIDAGRIIKNTLLYNLFFLFFDHAIQLLVALLLYELTKGAAKVYQTAMILPNFVSWVLVAYIGFALFSQEHGILNSVLESFNIEPVSWYTESKYWPVILTIFRAWKTTGMGSIIFYAALLGIDSSLFEAAEIDGANRLKQIWHISIPTVLPMVCLIMIMAVGSIMYGDFGLFYQVPLNSGALYPTTDIIATYIYRGLQSSNISQSAAVGLFQNVVGVVLLTATNSFVKKINPDYAMY